MVLNGYGLQGVLDKMPPDKMPPENSDTRTNEWITSTHSFSHFIYMKIVCLLSFYDLYLYAWTLTLAVNSVFHSMSPPVCTYVLVVRHIIICILQLLLDCGR